MPTVNPGPAITGTVSNVAVLVPVNTQQKPVELGTNDNRLLAVARGVPLSNTGDAAVMQIIDAASWTPSIYITANGQVAGVPASIASASIGIFTGPAASGSTMRTQATLSTNSAAGSSIATAALAASAALAFTSQLLYVNVGTALANATVDLFFYGYDLT
jgi:hypothetical protein